MVTSLQLIIILAPTAYIYICIGLLTLLSIGAWYLCRRRKSRCLCYSLTSALTILWYIFLYGTYIGFGKIEVNQLSFASKDLPKAFNGYRIVQFSDLHIGSYTGWREDILRRAVDSINAQQPDMIVFTGDLQNKTPDEITDHIALLSRLHARDGIYAVLGNHDYAEYLNGADEATKAANCRRTREIIESIGWTLLCNDHRVIRRGNDSIIIAGMENDGEGRFPQLGDIKKTLEGCEAFTIMLEHDPSSWQRKILPQSHAQLTLSGHTHAMQFALFGWSPVQLKGGETVGLYREGHRALYVSKGLGGVIPFRFGATGEITVITLNIGH